MKDKKIIHFKIPTDKNYKLLFGAEMVSTFLKIAKKELGKDYNIFATPFDVAFNKNVDLENVDLDTLTLKEFLEKYNL